jgi:DNA excision repair protein ERCC-6
MNDLFTLGGADTHGNTETGDLFAGANVEITNESGKKKRKRNDLKNIDGLDAVNEYADDAPSVTGDDLILQQLFDSTGVHSALKHDLIMDHSNQESLIVEQEASRVASEAVLALKVSRQQVRIEQNSQGRSVPTWTGRNGQAGSESSGPSSASILAKLRQRASNIPSGQGVVLIQQASSSQEDSSLNLETMDSNSKTHLISQIQAFFMTKPRFDLSTSDIISQFKVKVKGSEVDVFRRMLKGIARFDKDEFGNGTWILKQEFR